MSNIEITLPDGSKQSVAAGTPPIDVAKSISPRLADAAIVARVNGELYDLTRPLEQDARLEILTNKNPEALEVYRRHLNQAVVLRDAKGKVVKFVGTTTDRLSVSSMLGAMHLESMRRGPRPEPP